MTLEIVVGFLLIAVLLLAIAEVILGVYALRLRDAIQLMNEEIGNLYRLLFKNEER